jgi:hypothetical protein
MRPVRRYSFTFVCGAHTQQLFALGHSPCKAKAQAFEYLERLLKLSPELPSSGWRLTEQDDLGIAGC